MRKLGDKKHRHSKVKDHQNCSICRPEIKNGKAKHRIESNKEIEETTCTDDNCYYYLMRVEHLHEDN